MKKEEKKVLTFGRKIRKVDLNQEGSFEKLGKSSGKLGKLRAKLRKSSGKLGKLSQIRKVIPKIRNVEPNQESSSKKLGKLGVRPKRKKVLTYLGLENQESSEKLEGSSGKSGTLIRKIRKVVRKIRKVLLENQESRDKLGKFLGKFRKAKGET